MSTQMSRKMQGSGKAQLVCYECGAKSAIFPVYFADSPEDAFTEWRERPGTYPQGWTKKEDAGLQHYDADGNDAPWTQGAIGVVLEKCPRCQTEEPP